MQDRTKVEVVNKVRKKGKRKAVQDRKLEGRADKKDEARKELSA